MSSHSFAPALPVSDTGLPGATPVTLRAGSSFGVVRVDGLDTETLLHRLPVALPPMPQGLAPVKVASAVTRHDLDPAIASLPPMSSVRCSDKTG